MDSLFQDIRYSLRTLAKSPGFTAVAVMTLALGIGANTAVFTLFDALLLRPMPGIERPEELLSIGRTSRAGEFDNSSYLTYLDVRDQNTVFSGVTAYEGGPRFAIAFGGSGSTERLFGRIVTSSYFHVLGVRFARGQGFSAEDDRASGPRIAVISDALWSRRFGRDPEIVGTRVWLNARPATIVGVTTAGFRGSERGGADDLWLPVSAGGEVLPHWSDSFASELQSRHGVWMMLVARLKPGVRFAQAQAEVETIGARLRRTYPADYEDTSLQASPGLDNPDDRASARHLIALLAGIVMVVLLLACANVANLMLARGAARRGEIALRLALGAGGARIVRQLLTESVMLALGGGAAGLMLGFWCTRVLARLGMFDNFFGSGRASGASLNISPDLRVLAFGLTLSLLTSVVFGLAPAWKSSRPDVTSTLKDSAALAPRRTGLRSLLVAVQLALSLVLLMGAGLLLRTMQNYLSVNLGCDTRDLVLMSIDPNLTGMYGDARLRTFYEAVTERVAAIPGVRDVTIARLPPVSERGWGTRVQVPGAKPGAPSGIQFNTVAPNYFEFMRIPMLRGRGFNRHDTAAAAPVAVVNDVAARVLWPVEDAVGKPLHIAGEPTARQVIGVARSIKYRRLTERPLPYLYLPITQPTSVPPSQAVIHLRSGRSLGELTPALQREARAIDPNVPVFDAQTFTEHLGDRVWRERMFSILLGMFAGLALVLAMIGVYGVMSYVVQERRHEVGIRMALGAEPADILRLVMADGIRVVAVGTLAGIAASLALTRTLNALLFGVTPADPITLSVVTGLLLAAALLANYIPARRAAALDPLIALRHE